MNVKLKSKQKNNEFEKPNTPLEHLANANIVVGDSIITASGTQIIPLTSITVVNLNGGGEYGDVKTFKEADGFKLAGANGNVITVKPKGFLVDDGHGCRFIHVEDTPIDTLIDKTGELIHSINHA
jgi:uncharacterized spore protein YtfJ